MSPARDRRIAGIIHDLGALALDDGEWTAVLDDIAAVLGGTGASFEVIERRSFRPLMMRCGSGLGDIPRREYLEYYGAISPRIEHCTGKATGSISFDHMFFTERDIDRDEFYTDCMAPQGLRYFIAGHVYRSPGHEAVVSVQRSARQGHASAADAGLMKRLVPHLRRAVELKFRFAAARAEGAVGHDGLERLDHACAVVTSRGKIVRLNRAARDLLSTRDGVATVGRSLAFDEPAAMRRFERWLGSTRREAVEADIEHDFAAARPSGRRPYLVSLRALPARDPLAQIVYPAAALVFIRDPDRRTRIRAALLEQAFGLTRAQAEVAVALDAGASLADISSQRATTIATTRSHLYAILDKLNVRTQSELARVLMQYREPFA